MKNNFLTLIIACLFFGVFVGCGAASTKPVMEKQQVQKVEQAGLCVTMFNVGKADALLVQVGGKNALIDSGLYGDRRKLLQSLRAKGVEQIDMLILTHAHADHLGGMLAVLNNFSVKNFYDTQYGNPNSKAYHMILDKIEEKSIPVTRLQAPMTLAIADGAFFEVLWPVEKKLVGTNSDINANSLVMRLCYRDFRMMFTADSYKESEYAIMELYPKEKLHADIYKAAHHTSNTSNSWEWLELVNPEVVVASYANAEGVEFGKYPNKKTMSRIKDLGIKFYGTERDGNITIVSDGQRFEIQTDHSHYVKE